MWEDALVAAHGALGWTDRGSGLPRTPPLGCCMLFDVATLAGTFASGFCRLPPGNGPQLVVRGLTTSDSEHVRAHISPTLGGQARGFMTSGDFTAEARHFRCGVYSSTTIKPLGGIFGRVEIS